MLGGLIPILYFGRANSGILRLTKTKMDGKSLGIKGVVKKSYVIIGIFAVAMFGLAALLFAESSVSDGSCYHPAACFWD